MEDQDKLVLTELFTVIHEIQINAYVQNFKKGGFLQILKYRSLNSKAMVIYLINLVTFTIHLDFF